MVVDKADGVRGKAALDAANEQIRAALATLVTGAVNRSGIALPVDGPDRLLPGGRPAQ